MGAEVQADSLGEQFKGYVFKIGGGNDKEGFPMKQGVMVKGRVRLLLGKNTSCYRPRRTGERKRKTVRGCIVGPDIRAMHLVIVKKGENEIPGLTDTVSARRLGPKRVSKLRKLFAIPKADKKEITKADETALVKKSVVRRTWTTASGKIRQKAPKIQRLVTDQRIRRKRIQKDAKKQRWLKAKQDREEYQKLVTALRKKQHKPHKTAEPAVAPKAEPVSKQPVAPSKTQTKPKK